MLAETRAIDPAAASAAHAPVPHLRLYTERMLVDGDDGSLEAELPVLSLRFDHRIADGEHALRAASGDASEIKAQCLLETFGAVDLECVEHVLRPLGSEADYLVHADADPDALCSFTAHAVPRLRELGFIVEIDPEYPYQVLGPDVRWWAEIGDGERPDWFALELGIEVDGERVNLLPALLGAIDATRPGASLASLARVPAKLRAIRVGDKQWLTLPPERLARVLRVVIDLYSGRSSTFEAPLALAGRLGQLDAALSGPESALRWRGRTDVAARGRALAGPPGSHPLPVALKAMLRPYQEEGLNWMQHLRDSEAAGILADDMGLGKTLQTIALFAVEKEARRMDRPSLVVVPTSLVGNWQRELRRFAPHLRLAVWHGPTRRRSAPALGRAEVILTTYALVSRDLDVFREMELHYVVLDEAQAIKNPRCQASRAVRTLQARHRLCLTGTPIENHLEELWSLFDFLMPGLLGDVESFRRSWRVPIEKGGDDARLEALRERVAPFLLRRVKEHVAPELPPKTVLVRPVELEADQRDLYESIRAAAHADVRKAIRDKGWNGSAIAVLDALMKLRQVCCDPRLVRVPAAREVTRSAKLETFLSLLERQLAHGRRVLVFSQFTRMLALIAEALLARGIRQIALTGQTTDRQARVDAFEQGKADVFLISLKAGGTGLNLTSADTVIHYDPWWNAAAQAQATDRAYRIGQTRPVFVHNLVVAGSVEERMLALQERKKHLSDTLLGGAGAARVALSERDVDELLAPLDAPDGD